MIEKLISGGQTGADIAALDVALKHDFPPRQLVSEITGWAKRFDCD